MRNCLVLVVFVWLAGCLAPPHVRPDLPVPQTYPTPLAEATAPGEAAADIAWRDFFADPRLEALVAAALAHNRDLAVSAAQIEEARGLYRIQRADRLPTIAGTASGTRNRPGALSGGIAGDPARAEYYTVAAGVPAFELDFWGRVRNLSRAARSQYFATVEARRAFQLSLVRQVASAYLAAREAAERIELAQATLRSRKEGLRIAERRLQAGITSALDYSQAETLLTQAETELAAVRLAHAQSDNLLAVLVGGPVEGELPQPLPIEQQNSTTPLAAGLPSELLVRRPDVLAAEERLRAARANIGAARAAFLPSISLTGSYGYASGELNDLFGSGGTTWSYAPSISVPIFNFGRNRGNLDVAHAREHIAVASYERAIQTAFQEVSDALAGRRFLAEQVAAQERGTLAQRRIAELARTRYREGVVGYLEVLDAERNLFAAEQALLQVRRAEADNLVTLYVALGGGLIEARP